MQRVSSALLDVRALVEPLVQEALRVVRVQRVFLERLSTLVPLVIPVALALQE